MSQVVSPRARRTYLGRGYSWQALLCLVSGVVGVWAFAGAIGLSTGVIDTGGVIEQRIPFHSPVFAGLALAVFVALPMTMASVLAASGAERAPAAGMDAGMALVLWIAVQVAVIRETSWLQPLCLMLGMGVFALGAALGRHRGRVQ